jgi:hypothetical protein
VVSACLVKTIAEQYPGAENILDLFALLVAENFKTRHGYLLSS